MSFVMFIAGSILLMLFVLGPIVYQMCCLQHVFRVCPYYLQFFMQVTFEFTFECLNVRKRSKFFEFAYGSVRNFVLVMLILRRRSFNAFASHVRMITFEWTRIRVCFSFAFVC